MQCCVYRWGQVAALAACVQQWTSVSTHTSGPLSVLPRPHLMWTPSHLPPVLPDTCVLVLPSPRVSPTGHRESLPGVGTPASLHSWCHRQKFTCGRDRGRRATELVVSPVTGENLHQLLPEEEIFKSIWKSIYCWMLLETGLNPQAMLNCNQCPLFFLLEDEPRAFADLFPVLYYFYS